MDIITSVSAKRLLHNKNVEQKSETQSGGDLSRQVYVQNVMVEQNAEQERGTKLRRTKSVNTRICTKVIVEQKWVDQKMNRRKTGGNP